MSEDEDAGGIDLEYFLEDISVESSTRRITLTYLESLYRDFPEMILVVTLLRE